MRKRPRHSVPGTRALLVERQTVLIPFLRDALERAGHAAVVTSPHASDRTLRRVRPAMILFGPGAGGRRPLEAIRRLRRERGDARIVVIAYRDDPAWRALARALGADSVLGPNDETGSLSRALADSIEREENG